MSYEDYISSRAWRDHPRSEVLEFFEIAGFREGLGDWRPKFGKFSVKEIN